MEGKENQKTGCREHTSAGAKAKEKTRDTAALKK